MYLTQVNFHSSSAYWNAIPGQRSICVKTMCMIIGDYVTSTKCVNGFRSLKVMGHKLHAIDQLQCHSLLVNDCYIKTELVGVCSPTTARARHAFNKQARLTIYSNKQSCLHTFSGRLACKFKKKKGLVILAIFHIHVRLEVDFVQTNQANSTWKAA